MVNKVKLPFVTADADNSRRPSVEPGPNHIHQFHFIGEVKIAWRIRFERNLPYGQYVMELTKLNALHWLRHLSLEIAMQRFRGTREHTSAKHLS